MEPVLPILFVSLDIGPFFWALLEVQAYRYLSLYYLDGSGTIPPPSPGHPAGGDGAAGFPHDLGPPLGLELIFVGG